MSRRPAACAATRYSRSATASARPWQVAARYDDVLSARRRGIGTVQGNILYTTDGVNYVPVSRAGFPFQSVGFRSMVCFTEQSGKRTLITSPVGKAGDITTFDSDESDNPIALANDDPAGGGSWRNYSPMRMNDPDNESLFSLTAAGGWLYAGIANQVTGAQVWRTRGCPNSRIDCVPTWLWSTARGYRRDRRRQRLSADIAARRRVRRSQQRRGKVSHRQPVLFLAPGNLCCDHHQDLHRSGRRHVHVPRQGEGRREQRRPRDHLDVRRGSSACASRAAVTRVRGGSDAAARHPGDMD